MRSFEIRIPASTSNIGPGFDCLGLAFNLYNRVNVQEISRTSRNIMFKFTGPYAHQIKDIENNLFLSVFNSLCRSLGQEPGSLNINFEVNIPVYRGLGSSANAVLAAYFTARSLFSLDDDEQNILTRLLSFEGHPDNLTPSLTGGLTVSTVDSSRVYYKKYQVVNDWNYMLLVPDFYVSTEAARSILPETYKRDEIVYSLSRLPLLINAFLSGNATDLSVFLKDRIHHPYRTRLMPFYDDVEDFAYRNGAAGVALSGSGSTIVIIIPGNEQEGFRKSLLDIMLKHQVTGDIFTPQVDNTGTIVKFK